MKHRHAAEKTLYKASMAILRILKWWVELSTFHKFHGPETWPPFVTEPSMSAFMTNVTEGIHSLGRPELWQALALNPAFLPCGTAVTVGLLGLVFFGAVR